MNVHIITIGDEILIGQIVDTNSAWMGEQLNLSGFKITCIKTVQDQLSDITKNIWSSIQEADVVLLTGGLGATKDDVTKKAIADFLGTGMYYDKEVHDRITSFFRKFGREPNEAHRLQSYMPNGVLLLENKMGTAPGMWFETNGKILASMPGVPYEMKHLMTEKVIPKLIKKYGTKPIFHRTIRTAGMGETSLALKIESIESSLPANTKIAYLPNLGEVRIRVSAFGEKDDSQEEIEKKVNDISNKIEKELGNFVYAGNEENLPTTLGKLLLRKKMRLATAESCTGGNIAARIVRIPGSSSYFNGGIIAYSNGIKIKELGVKKETLESHGAVSEETVKEMVLGAINKLNVDLAIAVSGIAGPGGGSPEKPVGTIWIAVGNNENIRTLKLQLSKDRLKNIEYTTNSALNLARLFLLEN